jgi:hypothetical protein
MNVGAPKMAVITPIGISKGGKRVRERVSQTIINIAAARHVAGIRVL